MHFENLIFQYFLGKGTWTPSLLGVMGYGILINPPEYSWPV